uniref:Reverse transcriptase Ty1/copia-type domain-containing protein n=1 Tax=Tanacetum cinerariifolium TaxID=118510 RepID=A0A6L2L7L9_TANCI|nr:hypothetical protein [Tanacetum cinerariifolium]
MAALKEEMNSLRKNKTWELVDHLAGQKLPPGYEQGNKVRLLNKSFYGLKRSPRKWYKRFNEYMLSNGFKRSNYDNCVCYRSYALGKSKAEIGSTKSLLKKEFDMKDLGKAKKIIGMEIVRDRCRKILKVSQFRYISKILNNFRIDNEKSVKMPLGWNFKLSIKDCSVRDYVVERTSKVPYANAVGILMYLMVCTRPDIAYVEKTKHINVRYHFIREVLEAKTVIVLNVGTGHNVVDALTNVVPGLKLQHFLELLNVGVG